MAIDNQTLALAKKYAKDTVLGAGALKGKNVQVAKIEPIVGGNRVTFSYYTDDDVQHSSAMEVMNGEQGVSVISANVGENNLLTFKLSNGETINAGIIQIDESKLNLTNYYNKTQSDVRYVQILELNDLIENYLEENFSVVTQEEIKNLFK